MRLPMPLFLCKDCGLRIERSIAAYWKNRGRLLCSTCLDKSDQSHEGQRATRDLATGCNDNSATTAGAKS